MSKEKKELLSLIEQILLHGGSSIETSNFDPEQVAEAKVSLASRGFKVSERDGQLLFESANKRTLLKG